MKRFWLYAASAALAVVLAAGVAAQVPSFEFRSGQATVAVGDPQTAVALSSTALRVPWVMIRGLAANSTNEVYVGGPSVTSSTGFELQAGEYVTFGDRNAEGAGIDLNQVYIVGTTGVGVSFIYPIFH